MKKNNSEIFFFENLLNSTDLVMSVSKKDIKSARKSEGIILKRILKETGQWTILFSLLFVLTNIIRKIQIIFLTNKIIVVLITLPLFVGSYYGIKQLMNNYIEVKTVNFVSKEPSQSVEKKSIKKRVPLDERNKIEFQSFTSTSIDETTLEYINFKVLQGLKELNTDRINDSVKESNRNVKYIILGHVENIGKSFQLYIKIIDKDTSEVIFVLNKGMQKDNMPEEFRIITNYLSLYLYKHDPSK